MNDSELFWVKEPLFDTKSVKLEETKVDFFNECVYEDNCISNIMEYKTNKACQFLLHGINMSFINFEIDPIILWTIHNFGILKISIANTDACWSLPMGQIPVHFSGDIPINYYDLRIINNKQFKEPILSRSGYYPEATIYLPQNYLSKFDKNTTLTIRLYLIGMMGKPKPNN